MDKNVSTNNNNNNNSSAPNTPPHNPNETNPIDEGLETIIKTSEEVLAELNASSDEEINENGDGGANQDGGDQGRVPRVMVVALTADGSNTAVAERVGGNDRVQPLIKKRKYNPVRDPPAGKPTCPECKKEFASWRAAFGHMRKHPERAHRGFFPPPTFTPTAPVAGIHVTEDNGGPSKVNEGVLEAVRGLVIDLNRSIGAPTESSAGGSGTSERNEEAPTPAPENEEGRMKNVFDLNKLPPNEDDDDKTQEK
ncbi:hypothetical protein TSUD_223680 [Trifolium subterraneum]|uniref:C2H2-type domain-containing protein n=1 Tax=Trifolium subterraneum TaxID=3900 RepID=A0A2Z6MYD3_TRISU|nr:hypothetical protein TSUD_223680 [Trifolium subterraneum]